MPVNLSQIKDLLLPGLMEVSGRYKDYPTIYSKLFIKKDSKMALERTASMRYLGLAQLKTEGGQTAFDNNAGERFVYNQEHTEIALGYAITRKAIDDNLYKSQFQPSNLGLNRSFHQTKEILAASVFNNATVYNNAVGGDGQPILSTSHPIDGSVFANRPAVDVDLNEATLLNGVIAIRTQFYDNAGLRILAQPRVIAIPAQLEPVAIRLLKSDLRPGTSDNDVNAVREMADKVDYVVNPWFTSPYAWFILTDIDGLLYMERVPYETDMKVDFTTDNLLVKGYERYSFGYNDPRALWGTAPTS